MTTNQTPLKSLPPIILASITSAVVMYPVDVWRALGMASATGQKETLGHFVRTHGIKGLLSQGVGPEIGRATLMRAFKFFNYPIVHRVVFDCEVESRQASTVSRAVAGALATIPEVAFITPLELAKIGLQLDKKKLFTNDGMKLLSYVRSRSGFWGQFPGYLGVQGRQAAWTGTYFATLPLFEQVSGPVVDQSYRFFTSHTEPQQVQQGLAGLKPVKNLLAGFLAGVAGAIVNTPIDVVRTNLQKEALQELLQRAPPEVAASPAVYQPVKPTPAFCLQAFSDFTKMTSRIIAEKGVFALYYGLIPKAFHLGGGGALMAWLVPAFSRLLYSPSPSPSSASK